MWCVLLILRIIDAVLTCAVLQYSPYCHRVHIALKEVHADYKAVTINVMDWPQWYNTKVKPITRKVQPSS